MRFSPIEGDHPRVPTVQRAAVSSGIVALMVAFTAPWVFAAVLAATGSQLASPAGTWLTLAAWLGGVVTGTCWVLFATNARRRGEAIALGTVVGAVLFVLTILVWAMNVGWD
jgi:hypothetical protein